MQKTVDSLLAKATHCSFAQSRQGLTAVGLALVLFLEMLGYLLGSPFWFSFLYLIPISLVTWRVGPLQGVLIAVISALPYLVSDSMSAVVYSRSVVAYWNSAARLEFFFIVILALSISKIKRRGLQEKLTESTMALEAELEKHMWAEAVLQNLGMKHEELGSNVIVGLYRPSLRGETLCVVDPLGQVSVMNPNQPTARGPRSGIFSNSIQESDALCT